MDDKEYKIILVGDSKVGKSNLLMSRTVQVPFPVSRDMNDPQVRREVEESFLPDHIRNPPSRKNRRTRKKR